MISAKVKFALAIVSISLALADNLVGSGASNGCLKGLDVAYRNAKDYKDYMFTWNSRLSPVSVEAVVRPKSADEVMHAVKCGAKNTTISVRSGGHSYEGFWRGMDGGMVVDLRNMNKINLDKENRLVSVQAGALLGHVMAKLWEEDRGVLPHGLQPTIGMGGMTLGGGYGLLSRNYGLLADRVVSLKMVNVKGELLLVDENSNTDLFFALRGAGGGSFGVVTEFTYSYIKHEQKFTVARYNWNAAKNNFSQIVDSVMKYYDTNPTFGAGQYLNLSPGGSIELGITYSDQYATEAETRAKHTEHIKKLEAIISKWDKKVVQTRDWIHAYLFFAGYAGQDDTNSNITTLRNILPLPFQFYYKAKSGFLTERLSNKTIDNLRDIIVGPGDNLFILIDLWGGVLPNKMGTSFDNRDKYASVQIGATDITGRPMLDKVYKLLKPSCKGSYQNYIDDEELSYMQIYYPKSSTKLQEIKRKYDPSNTFRFAMSIPSQHTLSS